MDKIRIRDLHLRTIVGVHDWERTEKQDVILNIVLTIDLAKPASTDRLENAVNYRELKKRIMEMVENSSFQLIETLATKVAEVCLENPEVEEVTVTLDKPGALRFATSVAVEITRRRDR